MTAAPLAGRQGTTAGLRTSPISSLRLSTPGASASWLSSTTRRVGGPLGPGPWALWKGTWRGCCSWSGGRFALSRRRAGRRRRRMPYPAATGRPASAPPRRTSALRSASFSVSVPSPSPSSPPWPATAPCSPAAPARSAASDTPPAARRRRPDRVPRQSAAVAGAPRRCPNGATARAGCTQRTGAPRPGLRGPAAPRGPTAT